MPKPKTMNILELSDCGESNYSDSEEEFGDPGNRNKNKGLGPSSSFSLISPRARKQGDMLFSPSPRSLKSPKGKQGGDKHFNFQPAMSKIDFGEEGEGADGKGKDKGVRLHESEKDELKEEEEQSTEDVTFDMIRGDIRTFVTNRMSKGERLHCIIRRKKGGLTGSTVYELHIDPIQELGEEGEMLLLVGKRQKHQRTSNYHIHTSRLANETSYIGKVRANFMGTEFVVYDEGVNPKNAAKGCRTNRKIRLELGAVMYEKNLSKSNPRVMSVVMPNKPETEGKGGTVQILNRVKANDMEEIFHLSQKMPVWSEDNTSYMLDFYGRVTKASVKNFMLLNPDAAKVYKQMSQSEKTTSELSGEHDMEDIEANALLFGKIDEDLFVLDLSWPLSPLQAFSIVLTAFDSKLGCE